MQAVMASEYEGYRCRSNVAAGSSERTFVGIRSGLDFVPSRPAGGGACRPAAQHIPSELSQVPVTLDAAQGFRDVYCGTQD